MRVRAILKVVGRLLAIAAFLVACSSDSGEPAGDGGGADGGAAVPWTVPLGDSLPYLAQDPEGQLVVAGAFSGSLAIGAGTIEAQGYDLLLAGLDPASGALRFSATYGGAGDELIQSMRVDADSGDIALDGIYLGAATAGGDSFPPPPDSAVFYHSFFAGYDPSGAHRWSFNCATETSCTAGGGGLSLTRSGDALAAGWFSGTLFIDEVAYGPAAGSDMVLIRAGSSGRIEAVRIVGGASGNQFAMSAVADGDGGVYLAGVFDTSFTIDNQFFSTIAGQSQLFVAYLTASGTGPAAWGLQGRAAAQIGAVRGAVTADGDLVIAGLFQGSLQLGTYLLENRGDWDVFLARISRGGAVVWAESFGGPGVDAVHGMALDGDQVWLIGDFQLTADFGGDPLTSAGESDIVVAGYAIDTGAHVASRRFGGIDADVGFSLAVSGATFVGVQTAGTLDLGAGEPLTAQGDQTAAGVARLP